LFSAAVLFLKSLKELPKFKILGIDFGNFLKFNVIKNNEENYHALSNIFLKIA
jgi:hypothetical protein